MAFIDGTVFADNSRQKMVTERRPDFFAKRPA
jgi:hypothetical protein